MDIKKTRVERLAAFVKDNGGPAAVSRSFSEVDASYLSQLINGHRPFGEKSARNLEQKFDLPPFYFDKLEAREDRELYIVQKIFEQMDEKTRQQWIAIGNTLAKPEDNGGNGDHPGSIDKKQASQ
jgi:hypothetical protein